jgi:hypothetical protein
VQLLCPALSDCDSALFWSDEHRDDFANLDEMLPPKAMQEHYTIALNSLLLQLTPA